MIRSIRRLAAAVAALATVSAAGVAFAAAPPPTGPEYPPPGGVTLGHAGDFGRSGGGTWTYTDLEIARFDPLMWSVHDESLPQLSMDGASDEEGETMSWSASASDLAAGVLVFTGQAELPGIGTFPTSATITTTTLSGAPLPMIAAPDAGLASQIGGAAVIGGDFKANVLFKVGNTPAKDFFDDARTNPNQGGALRTSIAGGFYYVLANELPEASFGWTPEEPKALETVTFTSTAADPDGEIVQTDWDLDGDGQYDDATGATASHAFPEGGTYTVGVRVVDDRGGEASATATVTVRSCEAGPVSSALREVGQLAGVEPEVRRLNCDQLEPLGL